MRILLVEDETGLAEPLLALLARERYETRWAFDLRSAQRALVSGEPDLTVLDVMLPDGEDAGFDLARMLRGAGYRGGILFLTARDAIEDRVTGLDLGGDDYLVKPFSLLEFSARVRALLRRDADTRGSRLERGRLLVDFRGRRALWQGRAAELSDREFALLELFALNPDRVFTVDDLLVRLFPEATSGTRIVRVYVHHLRRKLAPSAIDTTPGGYRLGEA
jgi:DNA-binding response OmpR family regulator